MKTPWQYAETGTEYAHQVALFQWANVASKFGLKAANDKQSYAKANYAVQSDLQWNDRVPELAWLYANKNAVGRNNAIAGARNVAEGVKSGVPDLFLPVPRRFESGLVEYQFHGLYIELKRPSSERKRKGVASVHQDKWQAYLAGTGYRNVVCYGWEAARDALLKYLGRSDG